MPQLIGDTKRLSRGRFITFEGAEGAGKSTQVSLLEAALYRTGVGSPLLTREPGGSAGAEGIRRLLVGGKSDQWDGMTEALLYCAARRDHLIQTVWPALANGRWVVCDRFIDSTLAYQGGGQGVDAALLRELIVLVAGNFVPDLTIILDLSPKDCVRRVYDRQTSDTREHSSLYDNMDLSFHLRLHHTFRAIAAAEPERCVMVDASPDIPTVHAAVLVAVGDRLGVDLGQETGKDRGVISCKIREEQSA